MNPMMPNDQMFTQGLSMQQQNFSDSYSSYQTNQNIVCIPPFSMHHNSITSFLFFILLFFSSIFSYSLDAGFSVPTKLQPGPAIPTDRSKSSVLDAESNGWCSNDHDKSSTIPIQPVDDDSSEPELRWLYAIYGHGSEQKSISSKKKQLHNVFLFSTSFHCSLVQMTTLEETCITFWAISSPNSTIRHCIYPLMTTPFR